MLRAARLPVAGKHWCPRPRIPRGMYTRISFIHSELAPYPIGALFKHPFVILGSMHF